MKYNLTIDADTKVARIDYLRDNLTTVTGSDYISFTRLRDEKDGWWFDRMFDAQHNRKYLFADIVNLNGDPNESTQAEITAMFFDITDRVPNGSVVTRNGELIIPSLQDQTILKV